MMSQEQKDAVGIAVHRLLEWGGYFLKMALLAVGVWLGGKVDQITELDKTLAVMEAKYDAGLLAVSVRLQQNESLDDRQQKHIEAVDARVRDNERRLERWDRLGPTGVP